MTTQDDRTRRLAHRARRSDHEHPAYTSAASSARSLLIVSDLRAALEYDEQVRRATLGADHTSLPSAPGGLPPPPRPKSRTMPSALSSVPNSPIASLPPSAAPDPDANPYINPVPRLSHIFCEERPLVINSRSSSPDTISTGRASSSESYANVQMIQEGGLEASPDFPPKAEGNRHQRGISSLQRVEKMFGKRKSSLGKTLRPSRRSSDADVEAGGQGVTSGQVTATRPNRRLFDRGKLTADQFSSTPSSPTVPLTADGSGTSPLRSLARIGSKQGDQALSLPVRSHIQPESDMSSLYPSSDHTHDPPSSATESHISISSTIYTSSHLSFSYPYHPVSRPTSNMSDDARESFIDLTSPTFSPQSPEFTQTEATHYNITPHPLSKANDDPDQIESSKKPLLPRLATGFSAKLPISSSPKLGHGSWSAITPGRDFFVDKLGQDATEVSPSDLDRGVRKLPSTRNLLHPRERSDLVRKTRKLTQLFGQTPGALPEPIDVDVANGCIPIPATLSRRKHKPVASMLDDPIVPVYDAQKRVVWPPQEDFAHLGPRRHSVPLSPQDLPSIGGLSYVDDSHSILTIRKDAPHVIEIGSQEGAAQSDWDSHIGHGHEANPVGSPTSFIDLSDEEATSGVSPDLRSTETFKFPFRLYSPSTPSLLESLSDEQQAEEERRRKRERLAKLHRFLGSRVPPHLVLGPLEEGVPLPLPAPSPRNMEDEASRKVRIRRRRSSSAAEFAGTWSDEIDRLKDELNEREKAINVRRAVKMEKMFGVAPPQTLYHTRQVVTPPTSSVSPVPAKFMQATPRSPTSPNTVGLRNLNQSSYKGKSKKNGRPGTAESSKPLLDHAAAHEEWEQPRGLSDVYLHYRHSLNSLNDIIDRDDKQSLAELHDYLSGSGNLFDGADQAAEESSGMATPTSSTSKAERRRSLPVRASMVSVASEWTIPGAEDSTFQVRRRRAAKLTHFFGVNYRDLMNEILDSLEKGLEEERGKGTLKPDEIQELFTKLVKLKSKRNSHPGMFA